MYPEVSPERIKQQLLESVRPETANAVIPEVGEAAVFKPDSAAYCGATAFIKGRILQVHLDGVYAHNRRGSGHRAAEAGGGAALASTAHWNPSSLDGCVNALVERAARHRRQLVAILSGMGGGHVRVERLLVPPAFNHREVIGAHHMLHDVEPEVAGFLPTGLRQAPEHHRHLRALPDVHVRDDVPVCRPVDADPGAVVSVLYGRWS